MPTPLTSPFDSADNHHYISPMHVSATRAPATARDPALDGLRGFAVLLVFFFHFGGGLSSPHTLVRVLGVLAQAGWIGVVIFFALSGFLITGSLWDSLEDPHLFRNFYVRRALRILPLYYAVLLFVCIASLLHGASFGQLRPFAIFAFFLQNLPILWSRALINPSPVPLYHLWSLAVEEQFYLFWPMALIFCIHRAHSPRHGAIKLALSLFGLVCLFLVAVYGNPWIFPFRRHFDYFLFTQSGAIFLGAALALRMRSRSTQISRETDFWAPRAFFAGLALFLFANLVSGNFYLGTPAQFIFGLPGISLAAVALIAITLRPGRTRAILSQPWLCFVGRISYGFYVFELLLQPLIHRLALSLVPRGHGSIYFGTRFLLALGLTILAAWLSFHLLEQPFMKLKRFFPMQQPLP